jgi:hypothetical protein
LFRIFPQNFIRGNAATNNTPNEGEKKSSRKSQGSRKVTISIQNDENKFKQLVRSFCRFIMFNYIGNWKHMSELLSEHEKSVNHMRTFQLWTELYQRLRLGKTINVENQKIIENEARRWTEVFKRLISAIQFLASQNISFRGNTETLYARDNGNFLKLLEFIGKFDIVIGDHVRRITSKQTYVTT